MALRRDPPFRPGSRNAAGRHHILLLPSLLFLIATACGGSAEDTQDLAEGDRAPDFTLPSAAGDRVALSDFAGEKPALLYFSMGPG